MSTQLRIAGIVKESIVDGPGIRYVVFAQGCNHQCEGCHNPHTHSFDGGTLKTVDSIMADITQNPLLDGITLSGGEPFEQAQALAELAYKVHQLGLSVMTYTGYTYEEILQTIPKNSAWEKLLEQTDLLVEGRFELDKKNYLLRFRGSENQRIIDLKRTKTEKKVVLGIA